MEWKKIVVFLPDRKLGAGQNHDTLQQLNTLKARWAALLSSTNWYMTVIPELQDFTRGLDDEPVALREEYKKALYDFFEDRLSKGCISLGYPPRPIDTERQKIDTVVIHHTSNPPGLTPDRLSAIELIRLYAPYFLAPTIPEDFGLKGQPIYSGHERNGAQVFWPYHWIVRVDGYAERLLFDSEIGWHAGNWNVNCSSVAIVLDNDYEWTFPSDAELRAVAKIIKTHYNGIVPVRVLGHREITSKTTCPSELFLDASTRRGWKARLLAHLGKHGSA